MQVRQNTLTERVNDTRIKFGGGVVDRIEKEHYSLKPALYKNRSVKIILQDNSPEKHYKL